VRTDDYIGTEIFLLGVYEGPLLAALDRFLDRGRDGAVLLDVGANVGNHTVSLAHRFGRVVAVEPNPEVFAALELNVRTNGIGNVVALNCGLAGEEGELPFEIVTGHLGASGFALPEGSHERSGAAAGVERVVLPVRTGDAVVAEQLGPGERLGFVKIDVEGLEAEVLSGLGASVRRDLPVIGFEFNGEHADDWFTGHEVLAGYRFHEFAFAGALRPLDAVRNRTAVKWLELLVGHRKHRLVPLRDVAGRHHPLVIALPPGRAPGRD
jgi:FkbM family methyltransferase